MEQRPQPVPTSLTQWTQKSWVYVSKLLFGRSFKNFYLVNLFAALL